MASTSHFKYQNNETNLTYYFYFLLFGIILGIFIKALAIKLYNYIRNRIKILLNVKEKSTKTNSIQKDNSFSQLSKEQLTFLNTKNAKNLKFQEVKNNSVLSKNTRLLQRPAYSLNQLKQVRQKLLNVYPMDKFLLIAEPCTVVTSAIPLIKDLGQISIWVLNKKVVLNNQQNIENDQDISLIETEAGSLLSEEELTDKRLRSQSLPIINQKVHQIIKKQDFHRSQKEREEEIAYQIYNQLKKLYEGYELSVVVTHNQKWVGLWYSLSDCQYSANKYSYEKQKAILRSKGIGHLNVLVFVN